MRANRSLHSAKTVHIEPIDRSATKKTDDGYQGDDCPYCTQSRLCVLINYRCCYFSCLGEKLGNIYGYCQIQHNFIFIEYLCKLFTEYLHITRLLSVA